MRGLNIYSRPLRRNDDFVANTSGFIAAIVFGVISENMSITIVRRIDPRNTLPSKYSIIINVTIADARIFAKLFPTRMVDSNWSGLLSNSSALLAPLWGFLDKFFSLTLFDAIIPVSEPEKNPLSTKRLNKVVSKYIKEGFSIIN